MVYYLSIFAPLLGFLVVGLMGHLLGDRLSQLITSLLVGLACVCSLWVFSDVALGGNVCIVPLFKWIEVSSLNIAWTLNFDTLSSLMFVVVNLVSFLVHIYSIGYMSHDPHIPRFMAYLSLFTFMMLALVSANNMLQLFFGWEGVGLASYLLIGFWYHKDSACAASFKAFVVNRVGDLGIVLGMGLLFFAFNTLDITTILLRAPAFTDNALSLFGIEFNLLEVAAVFLFIGAMGKSAQLGLHTWLPDAMEGPTPVSALIHAATMVTAGVYLICRMSPLYELAPYAKSFVMIIGATTALFAGTVALTQNDIKRVIAYSTCSQLGYMFFATGAGGYSAAMFHLVTHAFFKALLFLGAGAVIHTLSDEQDMRNMGGIWKKVPITYTFMWIGTLALTGIPIFAGYYSKELILNSTWLASGLAGRYALVVGIGAAFLTSFYSLRLLWLTFHGNPRANEVVMGHVHESPFSMAAPMIVLAIGSLLVGIIPYKLGWFHDQAEAFWNGVMALPLTTEMLSSVPVTVTVFAKIAGISGMVLGILFYGPFKEVPSKFASAMQGFYKFLYHKWYFDELYQILFTNNSLKIGHFFWKSGDQDTIDKYGPDGIALAAQNLANKASKLQTGYIFHYAFVMAGGVAFIAFIYIIIR